MKTSISTLLVVTTLSLYGQILETTHYDGSNGLPSSEVFSVSQDGQGTMWFSTRLGVVSYDGREWVTYGEEEGLNYGHYRTIMADAKGVIWLTSDYLNSKAAWFDGERFHVLPSDDLGFPSIFASHTAIAEWNGKTVLGLSSRDHGVLIWNGEAWQAFRLGAELPDVQIKNIGVVNNVFYVLTLQGIYTITQDGVSDFLFGLTPPEYGPVIALAPDRVDNPQKIWLFGQSRGTDWIGSLSLPEMNFQYEATTPPLAQPRNYNLFNLLPINEHGLLFGNNLRGGIWDAKLQKIEMLSKRNGMITDGFSHGFTDREGNIWLSSERGVTKINSLRFFNLNRSHGLISDEVSAISEPVEGEMWFGHNDGVSVYKNDSFRFVYISPVIETSSHRVIEIQPDRKGGAYLAMLNSGLKWVSSDLNVSAVEADFETPVFCVLLDRQDRLWTGGGFGLMQIDPESGNTLVHHQLDLGVVRRIYEGPDDRLYLAAIRGLVIVDGDDFETYQDTRIGAENFYGMIHDAESLLVGSKNGAFRFKDGQFTPYPSPDQMVNRPVYFIMQDDAARVWMGTDNGVYRFDGNELRHYSKLHGLVGYETNRTGVYQSSSGQIWFGLSTGLSMYREHFDTHPNLPPLLQMGSVKVNSERFDGDVLSWDQNDLTFQFQVSSFLDEKSINIRYRLEGYDEAWQNLNAYEARSVRYPRLPPNRYRFHVEAENASSINFQEATSSWITIRAPYWTRGWFVLLALTALIGVLYLTFDYLSSKRHSARLEAKVQTRTSQLSQKNIQLEESIKQHRAAEARIQTLNEELEERVLMRTQQLEDAQKDLIENAHYAGMAEIVTSVLHNIGNILNSISTSGYMLRETIDNSKISALVRANELLTDNSDRLDEFILSDPRGKKLLNFYLSLGQNLVLEKDKLSKQTEVMIEKIRAIKDVLAQQHNYTSGVYQFETANPVEIIETAFKVLGADLDEGGLKIKRDFLSVQNIQIQKTKMIHILVNLLKNARESINMTDGDREIAVSLCEEDKEVVIRVKDTGIGISPENLKSIFQYGFTTKETGNGFGLHSAANAMKEMRGSIKASSEGEGKGAVFELRFPVADEDETPEDEPDDFAA